MSLAYSRQMQPMVLALTRRKNERETTWDAVRRCVKAYMYRQSAYSLCYACSGANLYAPVQMVNGFKRPYDNTNLWVSDDRADGEFIEIRLDAPRASSRIYLANLFVFCIFYGKIPICNQLDKRRDHDEKSIDAQRQSA